MPVNNKIIAKNTVFLYVRLLVIMAINFYMARVVLEILGILDYGIYNIVGTIVVIFTFLKSSLSEATQRFLNFEMGSCDSLANLKNIFSTCMNCYFIFVILVILLGEFFWFLGGCKLNIPLERYEAASFTFHLSLLTFVVSILQVPYNSTIIAYEKMDFFAWISIVEAVLKLLLTLWIKVIPYDKLHLYAFVLLMNSLAILFVYILYCLKKFQVCKYVWVWEKALFRRIISFTGWNMLGSFAAVLSDSGVNVLFNLFCGVVLNSSLGLTAQINNTVKGFSSGYMTAFNPQIVKCYAAKEYIAFRKLFNRSSKISFFLFFMISIPIIFNIDYLLSIWLVDVPQYTAEFTRIILFCSLIDATTSVFYTAVGATGVIRNYQLSISAIFLLHVFITYILLLLGIPYVWVFFSRILTRGILNFCVGVYFVRKQTSFRFSDYTQKTLYPIVEASIIPLLSMILLRVIMPDSDFLCFVFTILLFELITVISIYKFGLDKTEKSVVDDKSRKMMAKIVNRCRC